MLRIVNSDKGIIGTTSSLIAAMNIVAKDYTENQGDSIDGISLDWTGISLVVYAYSKRKVYIYRIEDFVPFKGDKDKNEQENAENPS